MTICRISFLTSFLLCWTNCGPGELRIETLPGETVVTGYRVKSVTGVRDGDRMNTLVVLVAGSETLDMQMHFRIGVPTRLESGQYRWSRSSQISEGKVSERSVTFLGGQSDRPNLGGVFELRSAVGTPQYRVRLPVSEVAKP